MENDEVEITFKRDTREKGNIHNQTATQSAYKGNISQ